MGETRRRFKAYDESELYNRFRTMVRDWSDEIENPSVDW